VELRLSSSKGRFSSVGSKVEKAASLIMIAVVGNGIHDWAEKEDTMKEPGSAKGPGPEKGSELFSSE
jgi:hypothetical protein